MRRAHAQRHANPQSAQNIKSHDKNQTFLQNSPLVCTLIKMCALRIIIMRIRVFCTDVFVLPVGNQMGRLMFILSWPGGSIGQKTNDFRYGWPGCPLCPKN